MTIFKRCLASPRPLGLAHCFTKKSKPKQATLGLNRCCTSQFCSGISVNKSEFLSRTEKDQNKKVYKRLTEFSSNSCLKVSLGLAPQALLQNVPRPKTIRFSSVGNRYFSNMSWKRGHSQLDDFKDAALAAIEDAISSVSVSPACLQKHNDLGRQDLCVFILFHYGYEQDEITKVKQVEMIRSLATHSSITNGSEAVPALSCCIEIKGSLKTPTHGLPSGERYVSCTAIYKSNDIQGSTGKREDIITFQSDNDSVPDLKHWAKRLPELSKNPPVFGLFSSLPTHDTSQRLFKRLENLFAGSAKFDLTLPALSSAVLLQPEPSENNFKENPSIIGFGLDVSLDKDVSVDFARHFLNEIFKNGFYGEFCGSKEIMEELFVPRDISEGDTFIVETPKAGTKMKIPVFRLKSFLFPNTELSLKIFEPRYRNMVKACIEEEKPFGLLYPGEQFGCSAFVSKVQFISKSTGESTIFIRGGNRFAVLEPCDYTGDFGLGYENVEFFEDEAVEGEMNTDNINAEHLKAELELRKEVLKMAEGSEYFKDVAAAAKSADVVKFSFIVAHALCYDMNIPLKEKMCWLSTVNVHERILLLKSALQYLDIPRSFSP